MERIIKEKICPICSQKVDESYYLNNQFKEEPEVNYLAHLIKHYRHEHITYWNKCWGHNGEYYRGNWFGDYEEEKRKVNERAKRQIIRKGKTVLKKIGIKPAHFSLLANTEEKTIVLANKVLG